MSMGIFWGRVCACIPSLAAAAAAEIFVMHSGGTELCDGKEFTMYEGKERNNIWRVHWPRV